MDSLQIAAVAVSLLLLYVVLDLVRRKKLTEEYSFIWIACAIALLAASMARHTLDRVAVSVGIYYPPAALLILLILFVFLASVSFSVVVSRQRQQIEKLIEDTALLQARVRELDCGEELCGLKPAPTTVSGMTAGQEPIRPTASTAAPATAAGQERAG